jgi:hypothetical protein
MRRREEKTIKVRSLLIYGLIVAVTAIWLVWWQWESAVEAVCGARSLPAGETAALEPGDSETSAEEEGLTDAERRWAELFGKPPTWPDDFSAPQSCQAVEEELAKLCLYLDGAGKQGGSCALLRRAAEDLAARPPRMTSELKRLETVLGNLFHLFRVLRGERMDRLRQLLREERSLAEPAAMALYRWLISREECARSGKTAIRTEPLYDYAGYLFQSVGGQAYLRRRSPEVEALASFYALLIIDRALEQKHNPHGIDPRPEIERTRDLLSGRELLFGERYLELLAAMEERWRDRAPRR